MRIPISIERPCPRGIWCVLSSLLRRYLVSTRRVSHRSRKHVRALLKAESHRKWTCDGAWRVLQCSQAGSQTHRAAWTATRNCARGSGCAGWRLGADAVEERRTCWRGRGAMGSLEKNRLEREHRQEIATADERSPLLDFSDRVRPLTAAVCRASAAIGVCGIVAAVAASWLYTHGRGWPVLEKDFSLQRPHRAHAGHSGVRVASVVVSAVECRPRSLALCCVLVPARRGAGDTCGSVRWFKLNAEQKNGIAVEPAHRRTPRRHHPTQARSGQRRGRVSGGVVRGATASVCSVHRGSALASCQSGAAPLAESAPTRASFSLPLSCAAAAAAGKQCPRLHARLGCAVSAGRRDIGPTLSQQGAKRTAPQKTDSASAGDQHRSIAAVTDRRVREQWGQACSTLTVGLARCVRLPPLTLCLGGGGCRLTRRSDERSTPIRYPPLTSPHCVYSHAEPSTAHR